MAVPWVAIIAAPMAEVMWLVPRRYHVRCPGGRACRKGAPVAQFLLERDVGSDLVQWHVARSLDHDLDVVGPRNELGQLSERPQLGQLGLVVGVSDRPRPQPVAQREGDIVGGHDLGTSPRNG